MIMEIEQALQDHLAILEDLDGFTIAEVRPRIDINQNRKYEIYLVFNKFSTDKKRIPETLCDHKVVTEYK